MCDPISMAVASMGVGGLQARQQSQHVNAVNAQNTKAFQMSQNARETERARQADFQTEAEGSFSSTMDTMSRENFDTAQEGAAAEFTNMLDARPRALAPEGMLPGQAKASSAVQEDVNRRAATEAASSRERIKALAALSGFGNAGRGRAETFAGAGDFMSTLGGLRRGSLGVAEQEQQIPAATVRAPDSTFLDLLSGGLSLAGGGAFGKGGRLGGLFGTGVTSPMRPVPRPVR
jgi:hypothetical protein